MKSNRIVTIAASNITSPLGMTTEENFSAVIAGRTMVERHENLWHLPHPAQVSLFNAQGREQIAASTADAGKPFSFFEQMAIHSISHALKGCSIDASSKRTLFVLSTTKGNVDMLRENAAQLPADRQLPGVSAKTIARYFGNYNEPIVVSNACISGACALTVAARLIREGCYDEAVVCGADELSPFIISGFHSLMAISQEPCRPFDEERTGINLGEAAATIILKGEDAVDVQEGAWTLAAEAIRNDAYHISSPSRQGEGCFRALMQAMNHTEKDELAFVNVHGTATMFNDEMEARALFRAGLSDVPINSLKGYFGHTMGAAGVLESIISMQAADNGTIVGTKGFRAPGVSKKVNISAENRHTEKTTFMKTLSGFGGCNAALVFKKWKQ